MYISCKVDRIVRLTCCSIALALMPTLVSCGGKERSPGDEEFGCLTKKEWALIANPSTTLVCDRTNQIAEALSAHPESSELLLTRNVTVQHLDLSFFSSQLSSLYIEGSKIKSVDVSRNDELRLLDIASEYITDIKLPKHRLQLFTLSNAKLLTAPDSPVETSSLTINGTAPKAPLESLVNGAELNSVDINNSDLNIEQLYEFKNLQSVYLGNLGVSSLDLSQLPEVDWVNLYDMNLNNFELTGGGPIHLEIRNSEFQSIRILGQGVLNTFNNWTVSAGEIFIEDPTHLDSVEIGDSDINTFSYREWTALTRFLVRDSQIPEVDLTDMVSLVHLELDGVGVHPDFSNNTVLSRINLNDAFDASTKEVDFSGTSFYWLEVSGSHLERIVFPETFEYVDLDGFGVPSPRVALLSHRSDEITFVEGGYVERFEFSSMKGQSLQTLDFTSFEALLSVVLTDVSLDDVILSSFDHMDRFVTRNAIIKTLDLSGLDDITELKLVDSTIETLIAPDSFYEDSYNIKDYTYLCRRDKGGNNNFSFSDEMLCWVGNDDG